MKKLRQFHEMKLKVDHHFDVFKQIEFYESFMEMDVRLYTAIIKRRKSMSFLYNLTLKNIRKQRC